MQTNYLETKPHYDILDGLRGVAAIMVVIFHFFEPHSTGHADQIINHGYLAVDFFFVLSGFVIGYAYDDRWEKMSFKDFIKRRLIRLHPMIVMGMVIGAICYYFGNTTIFPLINQTPLWKLILVMLIGCTLLPLPKSMDIHGFGEMHPLNGPAWSLFFEYIGNILYALIIRKLSKRALTVLVIIAACATVQFAVGDKSGTVAGGWSLNAEQLRVGFTRLAYPFLAGLLLSRMGKLIQIKHAAFWICSFLIVAIMAMPRIGEQAWMNGIYESACIILLFPLIVSMGAGGHIKGAVSTKVCKFLGNISYPLYITHYPFMYLYIGWVCKNSVPWRSALPVMAASLCGCILVAYACVRLYDIPIRKWLKKKFLMEEHK
jgi:peptidoglycan/LPS O-acetylase OafA/YrhL